jgi:hypothetical protein
VDEWQVVNDTASTATAFDIHFVDISLTASQQAPIRFTFFWLHEKRWEGTDYTVNVEHKSSDDSTKPNSSSSGRGHLPPVSEIRPPAGAMHKVHG